MEYGNQNPLILSMISPLFDFWTTKQMHLVNNRASFFDELFDAVISIAYLMIDCLDFAWSIFVDI